MAGRDEHKRRRVPLLRNRPGMPRPRARILIAGRTAVGSAPFTDFCTFAIGRDRSAGVKTSCTRLRWPDALDGSLAGRLQWRLRICVPPPVHTSLGELGYQSQPRKDTARKADLRQSASTATSQVSSYPSGVGRLVRIRPASSHTVDSHRPAQQTSSTGTGTGVWRERRPRGFLLRRRDFHLAPMKVPARSGWRGRDGPVFPRSQP